MIGQTLAHYRITGALGAGGMGEVYRATDTRLGRDVAIKLLPAEVATDAGRLARFRREAKLLAALSHPNIASIHELEEAGGTPFLVLELVEGENLAERLARGPLAVDAAVDVARQIAAALGAAHEKGIVHRDLKPANVRVTPGGVVKVLDFGLATTAAPAAAAAGAGVVDTERETLTHAPTLAGTVLGTPAYMSPEQARGRSANSAADVWSLGCVLFELLTGRRPFAGDTVPDLLVAVLSREPDWALLPGAVPTPVAGLLRQCLAKEPRDRPSARAVCDDLTRFHAGGRATVTGATPPLRRLAGVLGLLLLGLAVVWGVWRGRGTAPEAQSAPPSARRLSALTSAAGLEQWPAFSPDGRRVLYSAERDGFAQLFVRDLESGEERRLTRGARDDTQPTWSASGRTVAFVRASGPSGKLEISDALSGSYAGGDVWLVDLDSGDETRALEEAFNPAFSHDGRFLAMDASRAGPRRIWTTDARGRNPRQVTTDTSEAVQHTRPAWSPDGTRIVFQHDEKTKLDIRVAHAATGEVGTVTDDLYLDLDPVWSPTGEFIYFSSYRGGGLNIWRVPVTPTGEPTGAAQQLTTGAGQDIQPSLAPDATRVAFTVLSQNADLWRLPVDPKTGSPTGEPVPLVASTREDSRGAWSPDGRSLAFNSDRDGEMNIWIASPPGAEPRPLTRGPGGDYQAHWSPDGRSIAFFSSRGGTTDIWVADVAAGTLRQVTNDAALDVNPFFSPDGRTIAFQSDRDGRKEVWLVDADGTNPRQLSRVGAADHFMSWSDDGRSVHFRSTALPQNGLCRIAAAGGEAEPLGIPAGWHHSLSPDRTLLLDVVGHQALSIFPLDGRASHPVFVSQDPKVRIDYPRWSPDGRAVIFDRVAPEGGDIWLLDLEPPRATTAR